MTNYKNQKILKKRIRDENNIPFGMVVALNKDQLGYSICHSELDNYNDELALKIAISRAESHKDTNADFWIDRRKRTLKKNPIFYRTFLVEQPMTEFDFLESINYVCEYSNAYSDDNQREIKALAELKIMQERADRYFK